MKRVFRYIEIMLIAVMVSTIGCGCGFPDRKSNNRDKSTVFIDNTIPLIADAIQSRNIEQISSFFADPEDGTLDEMKRFASSCGEISKIYVDYGGFSHSKGKKDGKKYENVRSLSGLIITQEEPYKFIIDYTQYNKDEICINKLWIITGKTEAIENTNWTEKYHFNDSREFEFADYYDSTFDGECRLIWGEIICWSDNSARLDVNRFESEDLNTLDINGIRAKYGDFGGEYDTGNGYHILFYKSSNDGIYTQLFLNDDDTVQEVQETDDIGFGITGIQEITDF